MNARILPHVLSFFVIVGTALVLLAMGRNGISPSGAVKIWGDGSQHIADWYTASHLIHGFLFFGALWLVARRLSLGWRLVIATVVECAWEIVENTNMVIERYRTVTASGDYAGDAVINSVADIVAMVIAFWLAARLPVWASVIAVIALEALAMAMIRDGLALNVLMLIAPVDAIRDWQAGG